LSKRPDERGDEVRKTAPWWAQPLRWLTVSVISVYYRLAYRVVGWGSLPAGRAGTLLVANHQHEIESPVIVAILTLRAGSWRYPIFTVSSRRMWEPGFLAERIPWLAFLLSGVNLGPLFSVLGLQPIENELHARPFVSLAYALQARHGDLPIGVVFRDRALERLPQNIATLADLLARTNFKISRGIVTLSELHEPYRTEMLAATREQLEGDLAHFEALARSGATIFLAPEGFYSGDGKMQRMRGVLSRLEPLASICLAGISYDPFVGRRLCLLYRVQPAVQAVPLDIQLKRLRPVTTSALLATWLRAHDHPFAEDEAIAAVRRQIVELPAALFVEPQLRSNSARATRAALAGMLRLGMLHTEGRRYRLSARRVHPQFPRTSDMVAYQANFHEETLEGARFDVR
jgi:hypothetical protein